MAPSSATRDRWTVALLCAVVFVLSCRYFFPTPYFLDSFGYVAWIEEWRGGGELPSRYRYANTLLYYWPVAVFGDHGLKVVGVVVTTAMAAAYYRMIRRDFSTAAAVAAALLFFAAPPTVITATHLKEDLTSLLFFSISVLLIAPAAGPARMAAAGIAYGLSLLFKEVMLGAAPFILAYVHLRAESVGSYGECVDVRKLRSSVPRVLAFAAGAGVAALAISPTRLGDYATMASSPYMGQFFGLFSAQQSVGLRFWSEALLYLDPWYLLPVGFFAAGLAGRAPVQALYLAIAVVLLLFLANVSVVRMRHYVPVFFFLAPVVFEGTRGLVDAVSEILAPRRSGRAAPAALALAICAAFALANVAYVYPTIDYRLRYPPSRGFFATLSEELPGDALLLGMDNCPIAEHETGLPCENHPPDLDAAAASRYADAVADELSRRPVYLLPDFFGYDGRGHVGRAFRSAFVIRPVYSGWWEPYHAMTYGLSLEDAIAGTLRRHAGCVLDRRESSPVEVSDRLELEEITLHLVCRDGVRRRRVFASHGDHVTYLRRTAVSIVEARGGAR